MDDRATYLARVKNTSLNCKLTEARYNSREESRSTTNQLKNAFEVNGSSLHYPNTTVYLNQSDLDITMSCTDTKQIANTHVITIKVNTDITDTSIQPNKKNNKIYETFEDIYKRKNNTSIRLNVDTDYYDITDKENFINKNECLIKRNRYDNNNINDISNMVISSGQCSPSDTLDSGTCSDLDVTPSTLTKKKTKRITVTHIKQDNIDNDDNDSNISCDSLNSSEISVHTDKSVLACDKAKQSNNLNCLSHKTTAFNINKNNNNINKCLLEDIKSCKLVSKLTDLDCDGGANINCDVGETSLDMTDVTKNDMSIVNDDRKKYVYENDKFYRFHLNEKPVVFDVDTSADSNKGDFDIIECFAGYKSVDCDDNEGTTTIKSAKGTIRGVKNRVRAGIATFLQMQTSLKNYKDKDANKLVLYTTTMGIIRDTFQKCQSVKKILRNHLVKYEERDVFMSIEYQDEIRDRMASDDIQVPQLFIDGKYIGDYDVIEKLNESGELRTMLKPYKHPDACSTCKICGGFRLLPCNICSGSKKSLHRNHFTAEFVALKCMNCDEVGLIKCEACNN